MTTRDEMRAQLATVIGVVSTIATMVLIPLLARLIWYEPDWVDVALMVLTLPLVGGLVGAAVRWYLIYRWVAR